MQHLANYRDTKITSHSIQENVMNGLTATGAVVSRFIVPRRMAPPPGIPASAKAAVPQGDAYVPPLLNTSRTPGLCAEPYATRNFRRYETMVTPEMARGSQLRAAELADLKARGFKAVVNLRDESNEDADPCQRLGLNYLRLRIVDGTAPTMAQMIRFLDFVTDEKNLPVYVHCKAGVGRTGVAVACYRIAVLGWSLTDALDEAHRYGMRSRQQDAFLRMFATYFEGASGCAGA